MVIPTIIRAGTKIVPKIAKNVFTARGKTQLPRVVIREPAAQIVRTPAKNLAGGVKRAVGYTTGGAMFMGGGVIAERAISHAFPNGKTPASSYIIYDKNPNEFGGEIPDYAQNQISQRPNFRELGIGGLMGYGGARIMDDLSTPIFGEKNGGPSLLSIAALAAGGYIAYRLISKNSKKSSKK